MSEPVSPAPLDSLLAPYAGRGRDALLPLLWDVQTHAGHISAEAVHAISHCLRVPEADIYGVVGFYSLFHAQPTGERIVRVCTDPVCALRGADALLASLPEDDPTLTIEHSPCLGLCEHAPAALISQRGQGERSIAPVTDVAQLLAPDLQPDYPLIHIAEPAVLLAGAQPERAQTLAEYGDYAALRRALTLTPEEIVALLDESGLIGRGGAAFPTGRKWLFTRGTAATARWLVCNADESEPGTFKDRALMEACPHRLLEGMAIAARCIGARHAYLFIRGEYPLATQRLAAAIAEAEAANLLGEGICNSDFDFDIEIRRGAGAYICGEESALFEAIEGKRGFPRIKPPYPTESGLFGQPTTVNNVETLAAVPWHPDAWRGLVPQPRHRRQQRQQAGLGQRPRAAPRRLRNRARHHPARAAGWPLRRRGGRAGGGAHGRRGGHLPQAGADRPAPELRGPARGWQHLRLRRYHGLQHDG